MEEKNDASEQVARKNEEQRSDADAAAGASAVEAPQESTEEGTRPNNSPETVASSKTGKHSVGTVTENGTVIAASSVKDAPKPKKKHSAAVAVLSVVTVASLAFGAWTYVDSHPSGVAARVDNTTITEQEVADYINSYRTTYGLSNDANWAAALVQQGTSPNGYRLTSINNIIQSKVVENECTAKGVTVSDDDINGQIDEIKTSYGIEDDDSWSSLLTQNGKTEDKLREQIRASLSQQKLYEQEVPKPDGYDDAKAKADAVKTNDDGTAKKSKEQSILDAYTDLQSQWQQDCSIYLAKLLDAVSITIYPMPSDASYDVDMGLAATANEDDDAADDTTDASDSGDSDSSSNTSNE